MRPLPHVWLSALRAPAGFSFTHSELALVPHEDIAKLGAVKKPETLNYRTLLPEKDGLFSIEAFGDGDVFPNRDSLANTQPHDHVRATTFGRIDLPMALIHPLALMHAIEDVGARMHMPAQAVRATLGGGDEAQWSSLRERLSQVDIEPLLVRSLLVVPPYLRPMVPLEGGRWATSDLNDLYRRVVNRANRLARLAELGAPPIIINNEERLLYDAVESLFANELREKTVTAPDHKPLVSLWGFAGEDRFEALAEHERHAPLTRKRQMQLAAIRALGFELVPASATISAPVTTLGVPL